MATGFIWDERFAWFDAGPNPRRGPFYSPIAAYDTRESKERIRELLVASGLVDRLIPVSPRPMTEEELLRFHTPEYIAKVKALSDGGGGDAGEGAYLGRNCYDIAKLSAGASLEALYAVLDGRVDNAYALVRPCGHHATRDFGRGFSIFCNIALAILNAKAQGKDSGWLDENGDGPGRGYNINVPLPPGSGHGAYVETMRQVVLPALQQFRPEVIMVASGLDANAQDPLARMMCHSGTYREMATMVKTAAEELCGGRLVACHEGGYAPAYVPWCALAIIEVFAGTKTSFPRPGPEVDRELAWSGFATPPSRCHRQSGDRHEEHFGSHAMSRDGHLTSRWSGCCERSAAHRRRSPPRGITNR